MKRFTCLILIFSLVFMLNACSKLNDEDMVRQNNLEWLDESASAESINAGDDENSSNESNEGDELSIDAGLNILTSKNMPVIDTLVYKGSEMSYNAVLTNGCSYTADYTFFILINGYLQPFTLEASDEQLYSAAFTLKAGEEKIIHFTFTPIAAPYGDKVQISFAGLLTNKSPVLSNDLLTIILNSADITYDTYLTAESSFCQITMKEDKNIIGSEVEKLKAGSNGEASQIVLSDKEKNSGDDFTIKTNELNSDNRIAAYAQRINNEKIRMFLWCEGEFLPVFDGEYYADIPDNEYALYEIPIDNSMIKDETDKRYMLVYVDMSVYQSVNDDGLFGKKSVGSSCLYVIS